MIPYSETQWSWPLFALCIAPLVGAALGIGAYEGKVVDKCRSWLRRWKQARLRRRTRRSWDSMA